MMRPMDMDLSKISPASFEAEILPHLDAAYNLALYMTRQEAAARDVVQESLLNALKAWQRFNPGNPKAWLLMIVRRECLAYFRKSRIETYVDIDDEAAMTPADRAALSQDGAAEHDLIARQNATTVRAAIAALPPPYREVILLREIEDMAYLDIAQVLEAPLGTIMSRLSRARTQLKALLVAEGLP